MTEKVLLKGNEAFAEAAIRGGCRFYVGYPITPQNEIPEYMSRVLPSRGGVFMQAESELGTINIAYGIGCGGGNVFISSSSPGIALMQEGFSFFCSAEIPLVVLNVSRGGPGIGGIQPGQADYFQATRGGGNGDYRIPVLAPATIQEAVDLIYESFALADRYRNPIMILADGMMAQMMEPVQLPEPCELVQNHDIRAYKPWALTGQGENLQRNVIVSYHAKPIDLEAHVQHMFEKYQRMEKEMCWYEKIAMDDAEIVFVAFGTVARIVSEVIGDLRKEGIKAGMVRPISLVPFPYDVFHHLPSSAKVVISAELSMGQMIEDVRIGVNGKLPVRLLSRTGGVVPSSSEIKERAKAILGEIL